MTHHCFKQTAASYPPTIASGYGCIKHGFHHEIQLCPACDLGITYPECEELSALYEDRDSNDFQKDDHPLAARLKTWMFSRQAKLLLNAVGFRPNTVIDIGCGDGRFTQAIAHELGAARVVGVDFHPFPPPALLRNPRVEYMQINAIGQLSETCDLLIMRHSLEHTKDPVSMLEQLKGLLRPGGQLFIEVPNRRSPWANIFGRHWEMWYMPYHRVHFSRRSLKGVIEAAGLIFAGEGGSEMPVMGRSLRNVLQVKYNVALFAAGIALQPLQIALSKLMREPTCLVARAIKPATASRD